MFSSPKFHEPSLKLRYVIFYFNCSIKPFAVKVPLALQAIYSEISRYTKMLYKVTGVNRNWIILNNRPIMDALKLVSENGIARNIQTFDFLTLYTSLEHKDIKEALLFTIKLAFRNKRSKYISVCEKSFSWVNSFKDTTFAFNETKLSRCVNFLLDDCYFK